jgi:hypothetical protein
MRIPFDKLRANGLNVNLTLSNYKELHNFKGGGK